MWKGDVVCMFCQRAHLCEPNEAGALVYPHVREDGFCACGTALFPNGDRKDFAAQPKCPECARIIWARQQPQTTSASP